MYISIFVVSQGLSKSGNLVALVRPFMNVEVCPLPGESGQLLAYNSLAGLRRDGHPELKVFPPNSKRSLVKSS